MNLMEDLARAIDTREDRVHILVEVHPGCHRDALAVRWLEGARGARLENTGSGLRVQAFRWLTAMDERPFGRAGIVPFADLAGVLAHVRAGGEVPTYFG